MVWALATAPQLRAFKPRCIEKPSFFQVGIFYADGNGIICAWLSKTIRRPTQSWDVQCVCIPSLVADFSNPHTGTHSKSSSRRRATHIPYALLLNFGRPQLQYDTFDLAKLPSGSVIETAYSPPQGAAMRLSTMGAAQQITETPSLTVESESSSRSTVAKH